MTGFRPSPPAEGCNITSSGYVIIAECAVSTATCFQMIAQQSNSNEIHKLHTGRTADDQMIVSIQVDDMGMYKITIFAIEGERGIIDSNIVYSGQWTVGIITITDNAEYTPTNKSSTSAVTSETPSGSELHV